MAVAVAVAVAAGAGLPCPTSSWEGTGTLSVRSSLISDAIDAFQAMQLSLATNLELRAG